MNLFPKGCRPLAAAPRKLFRHLFSPAHFEMEIVCLFAFAFSPLYLWAF
jgi:hypothetical protein